MNYLASGDYSGWSLPDLKVSSLVWSGNSVTNNAYVELGYHAYIYAADKIFTESLAFEPFIGLTEDPSLNTMRPVDQSVRGA